MAAKTILVVEAERHIMRLIQVHLQRAGYTVVMAFNGQEALKLLADTGPDLLIIDQSLPDMTGNELGQRISDQQGPHMPPVLMLIPKNLTAGWLGTWYRYPNCYMTKPFNPAEVVRFVQHIFESVSQEPRW